MRIDLSNHPLLGHEEYVPRIELLNSWWIDGVIGTIPELGVKKAGSVATNCDVGIHGTDVRKGAAEVHPLLRAMGSSSGWKRVLEFGWDTIPGVPMVGVKELRLVDARKMSSEVWSVVLLDGDDLSRGSARFTST